MIGETSLMMGFTFIVGMAFAYVLKLMTFFFSRLNGTEISALLRKGRIWGRAYRMDIARTDRYIRSVARIGGDEFLVVREGVGRETFPPIRMRTMRWTLWPNTTSAPPGMPHGKTAR